MSRIPLEQIGFYTLSDDRCKTASSSSRLMRGEIVLTDACNFKCPYCRGQRNDLRKTLSQSEATYLVNLFADHHLKNIRFSGGEPTCWKGLEKLVEYTRKCGIDRIALSTNGSASLETYKRLIDCGVNDFSISLDACCSQFGDKMAGVAGVWDKVVSNIAQLSKLTYLTVGVVVTPETVPQLRGTIEFADSLGVSDIRIISAAQYNEVLSVVKEVPQNILDKYPILKYRVINAINGINVRGIEETDSRRCWIGLDDVAVAGDYHYPCIIYLREQGNPIGRVGPHMRKERTEWVARHNTKEDPICKKNCLDCIVQYNRDYRNFRGIQEND